MKYPTPGHLATCSYLVFSPFLWLRLPASAEEIPRSWEIVSSPSTAALYTVCYGNGRWLALGGGVITSNDGVTWQKIADVQGLPTDPELWGRLRFVHDRFLMQGAWKQSLDGKTWTDFPVPTGRTMHAVEFAGGRWVCVGEGGLFAVAEEPGRWTVSGAALTSNTLEHLVYLNGTWHAFSFQSNGMRPFSSVDGLNWTIQPLVSASWFSSLETGEITQTDGSVESVAVGTTNTSAFVIVRSSDGLAVLESRQRTSFGRLEFRRSFDGAAGDRIRREWVNVEYCCYNQSGPQVHTLTTVNETPVLESLVTTNDLLDVSAGPDAMIAVGTGGLIRRYPTRQTQLAPILTAEIRNAVEISWQGKMGASYMIQESADGETWTNSLPSTLAGAATTMKWTTPVGASPGRLFRVQEF